MLELMYAQLQTIQISHFYYTTMMFQLHSWHLYVNQAWSLLSLSLQSNEGKAQRYIMIK